MVSTTCSVRRGREECRVQPLRSDGEPFCVAAGAEVAALPALAGEGQQILVRTVVAADARESVLQHAAGEELVGDLRDGLFRRNIRESRA